MTHAISGLDRLHSAMAARIARGELPGMVILIDQDGDMHVDPLGVTAFGGTEPMRRDTLFRIASMTKPILAAATMLLVEGGRLRLDDPVERWLPELANRRVLRRVDGPLDDTVPARRSITVEDLLTSRMGYGMVFEPSLEPPFPVITAANDLELNINRPDPRTPLAPDEWLRRFATLPLMYQPGERWQYNSAFQVLGVLVARAATQPLGDFFHARLFEPLGMRSTGFWLPAERTRTLPSYYTTDVATGRLELHDVSRPEEWSRPPAFPSGAGGLVSTVDDFLQFARLLLNGGVHQGRRLLSAESVQRMTTNKLTPEQVAQGGVLLSGRGWGYGVGVVTEPDADWPVPGRYGWAGGYGTVWFNDPHRRLVALAMTQVSDFMWNGGMVEFEKLVGACTRAAV